MAVRAVKTGGMLEAMTPPAPPPCKLVRLSTDDAEPALRFDAWRERAHRWVDLLPPLPGSPLDAELLTLHSEACTFGVMRSTAYEMRTDSRRAGNEPGMVVLTLIQSGHVLHDAAPGTPQRIGPGMLGLYDTRGPGHYRWGPNSREVFLALPRPDAAAALGREPGNMLITPAQCALVPLLSVQLEQLAQLARSGRLDAADHADLLQATRALALLTLRNLGRQGRVPDAASDKPDADAAHHAAALQFMRLHAHRHDLDVAAIAHGAACSRTRLYEAFAAQGATVMGALREQRLLNARALIEQSARLNVGALSWRCGFADQSSFSKLFRKRFGLSPTEWHQRMRPEPAP